MTVSILFENVEHSELAAVGFSSGCKYTADLFLTPLTQSFCSQLVSHYEYAPFRLSNHGCTHYHTINLKMDKAARQDKSHTRFIYNAHPPLQEVKDYLFFCKHDNNEEFV